MDGISGTAAIDRSKVSPEEWTTRVELAAVYRLLNHYGWDEFIYNHAAARVPGEPNKFLIKKHDHLYTEVTASNLVKVDIGEDIDASLGVNKPGFILHSGVFAARPDVKYSIHIHTATGGAVAALQGGLKMISQPALRFYGRVGFHEFEGIVDSKTEQAHIARDLANHRVLILRYHGVLVVGEHCAQVFGTLRHLMTACELQLLAQSTGEKLVEISPEICAATAKQVEETEKKSGNKDMGAYIRLAESLDPGFRN
jgi:ribulose-5-phosphate 4-epimerase/fuculose-1-phosphate aldolase